MRRALAVAAMLAFWTGQSYETTTVTGRRALACEYDAGGERFWRLTRAYTCPMRIEVE